MCSPITPELIPMCTRWQVVLGWSSTVRHLSPFPWMKTRALCILCWPIGFDRLRHCWVTGKCFFNELFRKMAHLDVIEEEWEEDLLGAIFWLWLLFKNGSGYSVFFAGNSFFRMFRRASPRARAGLGVLPNILLVWFFFITNWYPLDHPQQGVYVDV
jgi:hypothetical protein